VEDQPWQSNGLNVDSFDFQPNLEASYRVKIEGRLLEDNDDEDADGDYTNRGVSEDALVNTKPNISSAQQQKYRFSHFFKALSVDFDKARIRTGAEQSVEWKKPDRAQPSSTLPAAADFDELTFKRQGDENLNITINLFRHEEPERFLLSADLAEIVDMSEATRQEVMLGIWEYIKLMGLQEDEEKRNFRCDELLKRVRSLFLI
jgi:chromatin remodeling complex protein RSC6